MTRTVHPGTVSGTLSVPTSKSHTIRALLIATLAEGESIVRDPLDSEDTGACIDACRALGADIVRDATSIRVTGTGGDLRTPEDVIDVGNSGTTLYLAAAVAALQAGLTVFTGDSQIRNRSAEALLSSLADLGAEASSTRGNGCAPLVIGGGISGGTTSIACPTSQYLSALLLATPLGSQSSVIDVTLLNERPYVDITLGWLDRQQIQYEQDGYTRFVIPGGQSYHRFDETIPGDYSSATFFLCAAALCGTKIRVEGLRQDDPQGDQAVLNMLETMGCTVVREANAVEITGSSLEGATFDLNATPDALPALAVTACVADGETRLENVPQARMKETDRISVMCKELAALGADISELPDGLVINGSSDFSFSGGSVDGHADHRVVMALAIAALRAREPVEIATAESAAVTFPRFFNLLDEVRQ